MRAPAILVALIGAAALALAGCGGVANGPGKAGGHGRPITLRLGTPNGYAVPDTPLIEYFARQVAEVSGDRVRVSLQFDVASGAQNSELVTAKMVRDGTLDLGWIGARAWDLQGVLSLQALQAPFLITSDDLLDQVLTSPVAGRMLAGLRQAGMVGLGLYPDELRHPVGLGAPLLSLKDFRGARIRVFASNAADELMRALGAEPVHLGGSALADAVNSGELRGIESSTGGALLSQGKPILTANITFYPKAITLFADGDRFAALSADQQNALRTAAQRTLDFAVHRRPDAGDAAKLCSLGGAVVLAGESDVAAIERAGESVFPMLQRDAQTRSFIEQIRQLKQDAGPVTTELAPCGTVTRNRAQLIPDGVYTTVATKQDALRNQAQDDCALRYGGAQLTLYLTDGRFRTTEACSAHPETEIDNGAYTVTTNRFELLDNAGVNNIYRWSFDGHVLTLRWIKSTPPLPYTPHILPFLYGHAWQRS